eukprot:SAG31_NODE_4460_length_3214_cov_1.382665_4_plen_86_part_00
MECYDDLRNTRAAAHLNRGEVKYRLGQYVKGREDLQTAVDITLGCDSGSSDAQTIRASAAALIKALDAEAAEVAARMSTTMTEES